MDLKAAAAWLRSRQRADGLWAAFETFAGEATAWTTAWVATALPPDADNDAARAHAVQALLREQQPGGGWGCNPRAPANAAATAGVVRLLAHDRGAAGGSYGGVDRALARAAAWLLASQRSDGGFATYPSAGPIRAFTGIGAKAALDGWCAPHVEVTASCGLALQALALGSEARHAWQSVRRARRAGSGWASYWWSTDLFATAEAMRLAERVGADAERRTLATELAEALQRSQSAGGAWRDDHANEDSVFATALALRLLATSAQTAEPAVARARAWLADRQRADGAWDGEPVLRIPPPFVADPAAHRGPWRTDGAGIDGTLVRDPQGLVTTAAVLAACAGA